MLEAVLSARRVLYISWAGHHVRDNSEQPPSVLVSQLREYLASGWCGEQHGLLQERTWHHPLQPFSRRYFEQGTELLTYAAEWRAAHAQQETDAEHHMPAFALEQQEPLTVEQLTRFVRNPAQAFFRQRLGVYFEADDGVVEDDEVFQLGGLQAYGVVQELQQQFVADWEQRGTAYADGDVVTQLLQARVRSLQRAGRLPLAGVGQREAQQLQDTVAPCLREWLQRRQDFPRPVERLRLHFEHAGVVMEDWLDQLWSPAQAVPGIAPLWLQMDPRDVLKNGALRKDKLLRLYVRSLVAAACGVDVQGVLIGRDAALHLQPMAQSAAQEALRALLSIWLQGQNQPLPLPSNTGMALAWEGDEAAAQAYEGGFNFGGECEDMCWQRVYPDFEALSADGQLHDLAEAVYGPMQAWIDQCVEVVGWSHPAGQGERA